MRLRVTQRQNILRIARGTEGPQDFAPPVALARSFICWIVVITQFSLPAVHAFHVMSEESAGEAAVGTEHDEQGTHHGPENTCPSNDHPKHHHHDESHCAVCQAFAQLRDQGLISVPQPSVVFELTYCSALKPLPSIIPGCYPTILRPRAPPHAA